MLAIFDNRFNAIILLGLAYMLTFIVFQTASGVEVSIFYLKGFKYCAKTIFSIFLV